MSRDRDQRLKMHYAITCALGNAEECIQMLHESYTTKSTKSQQKKKRKDKILVNKGDAASVNVDVRCPAQLHAISGNSY